MAVRHPPQFTKLLKIVGATWRLVRLKFSRGRVFLKSHGVFFKTPRVFFDTS